MQLALRSADVWRQSAVEPAQFASAAQGIVGYRKHCGPDEARRLLVYAARLNGEFVGTVSIQRNFHPAIAVLGLHVAQPHTGRGYATELARRIVAFGFDETSLNRIEADVATEKPRESACHGENRHAARGRFARLDVRVRPLVD
jgi:RimJ/RimL family protein N-acetyltransferase